MSREKELLNDAHNRVVKDIIELKNKSLDNTDILVSIKNKYNFVDTRFIVSVICDNNPSRFINIFQE